MLNEHGELAERNKILMWFKNADGMVGVGDHPRPPLRLDSARCGVP